MLNESDRRSLAEIDRRLCATEPMLAILARRFEPAIFARPRVAPERRRRASTMTAMVATLLVTIGVALSLPAAFLACGVLAGGAVALRTWRRAPDDPDQRRPS